MVAGAKEPAPGWLDEAIAAPAARQYGVVARRQPGDLRLSDGAIAHRCRSGRLHRVHHGVYAVGHTVIVGRGRWLAAVLACGPNAVLSHAAAARSSTSPPPSTAAESNASSTEPRTHGSATPS